MNDITFGAFAKPLHEQLNLPPSKAETWQKYADAITLLHVQGLLPNTETRKARYRLVKRIQKELK